jgi:opacity protein-like surface antigen
MNAGKAVAAAALMLCAAGSVAAPNHSGVYVMGSVGAAHTSLDAGSGIRITNSSANKFTHSFGAGLRFNTYMGAEMSYVAFRKPSYHLIRGSTGEVSTMTVENTATVVAATGYLPVNSAATLMGKVGAAFVYTKVNRVGAPSYSVSEDQVSPTAGIGGLYKINQHLDLRTNLDWYPKLTEANENATDTDAYAISIGLQYKF